ncbi:MAG: hypothetical protein IME96_00290 [Proteobacteria bacterium]|nr:hypothetical protein [Pseudomonadota bacterium]
MKILFVCIGNACRSPMAEGFARFYSNGRVEVKSAGTSALGRVVTPTKEVMMEIGIDISNQTSDQLTKEMIEWADIVVSMSYRKTDVICPRTFNGRKIDWAVVDPIGMEIGTYRRVRDELERRVKELLDENLGVCRT